MKKSNCKTIDLGLLQSQLENSTSNLKRTQKAKLRADEAYERAVETHERARVALNAGVTTLKVSSTVPNPYAS